MPKFIDCFLYHNEEQLLEIRLQLLNDYVDRFVIVCSKETFTGKRKKIHSPKNNTIYNAFKEKIDLIEVDLLEGKTAWEKESFSRNLLATKLHGLSKQDLIMISDIDEMPRPSVIEQLKKSTAFTGIKVLELDNFNFKFNYKLFHGLQSVWGGPTVCLFSSFTSPQEMRDYRWKAMSKPESTISDAGWHFSFLSDNDGVSDKLASFSHQEYDIQGRTDDISWLMEHRQGFYDHLQAGSVWGFIDVSTYFCSELETLVRKYPAFYEAEIIDDLALIEIRIKRTMLNVYTNERAKILRWCSLKEIVVELKRRLKNRLDSLGKK